MRGGFQHKYGAFAEKDEVMTRSGEAGAMAINQKFQGMPPRLRQLAKKRILVAVPLGLIAWLVLFETFTEYVPPYEYGIKASRFGGGIVRETLLGGRWYFTAPGVDVHHFPRSVQTIEMTDVSKQRESVPEARVIPRIEIDTSDGSKVQVDVTVLYRITDPILLIDKMGPGKKYEGAVETNAVGALKKNLGQLLAEDFYHESKRVEQSEKTREHLNASLKEFGVLVDHVLVRQYYYEQGYQQQIENRKVQDQLVFTNRSLAEASKEDAARRKIEAEGKANADVEQQRGDAEVTKIRAEAELYKRKKESEGDTLVKIAEARGTSLVNTSYASAGSDNLVALEMAKVLDGISVLVVSDTKNGINPLDVEQMTRMLGGK
jgi:regulator of protease activity HflC (stomatin/prohibitin superfamily)